MHVAAVIAVCVAFQLDPFPKNEVTTFPFVHSILTIHWVTAYLIAMAMLMHDRSTRKMDSDAVANWSDRYAAGVASVIRNQMTVVLGVAELCDLDGVRPKPMMQQMQISADRLCDLSDQLLACGGRAAFPIQRRQLELALLIDWAVKQFAPNLILSDTIPNVRIWGDEDLIRIALRNVLTNAIEASPAGPVTIRSYLAFHTDCESSVSLAKPGRQHVVIEIEDRGCGMIPSVQSRIFEPFFSTKSPDRGLGLTAVQGIMQAMAGEISVESVPDVGTTVKLSFATV
jgi:signal transduction histidine kinase